MRRAPRACIAYFGCVRALLLLDDDRCVPAAPSLLSSSGATSDQVYRLLVGAESAALSFSSHVLDRL